MDIQKLAVYLKKVGKVNIAIGIIASVIANILVQSIIPGHPLSEYVIGAIVNLVIFLVTLFSKKDTVEKGIIMALHKGNPVPA